MLAEEILHVVDFRVAHHFVQRQDIDPETHRVYLATAEFEELKAGATGRPMAKPGTFMIVVVGRH